MSMSTKPNTQIQKASPLYGLANKFNIDPNKLVEVLRGTVIKPNNKGQQATNEEVAAFCIVAQQYGLNPFTREIHAFTSGDKGVVPIVGIDGWTHIVNQSGQFDGCEFDELAGEDGKPESITCKMYVKGRQHPVCATERFSECKRNSIPWQTMPWRMLRHKAYMQAARYAFGLSGIYDEDEARDIVNNQVPIREPIAMPKEIKDASDSPAKTEQIEDEGDRNPQFQKVHTPQQQLAAEMEARGVSFDDFRDFIGPKNKNLYADADSLASFSEVPEAVCQTLAGVPKLMAELIKKFGKHETK